MRSPSFGDTLQARNVKVAQVLRWDLAHVPREVSQSDIPTPPSNPCTSERLHGLKKRRLASANIPFRKIGLFPFRPIQGI